MEINAEKLHFSELNGLIKSSDDKIINIANCLGHRYIGSGVRGKVIDISGVPGNALGAYLSETTINVHSNAQDATGDTMDTGDIIIYGNCGDTTGYGMRGGRILIKGNAGYRVGIHMKEYKEHKPLIVVGGKVGDFLGEYQAGGIIVVLGIGHEAYSPVGYNCGTGMHGGKIFIRSEHIPKYLPAQVLVSEADQSDLAEIKGYIEDFCNKFGYDANELLKSKFIKLTPNTKNPYRQLYTHN
ncbi:MAG TPA: glutamate synthase [Ruminococcaceae bacterium]|nr:glutamate synthase [Oscillospiraceae bacterium]